MDDIVPVFEDEIEQKFEEKARKIFAEEIKKSEEKVKENVVKEIEKTKKVENKITVKDKIDKIKEQMKLKPEPESKINKHTSHTSCPGCKDHDLHVHDGIAKCTGPNCGKEFLLVEKQPEVRKQFMCTTCGHTMTKEEATKLNESKKPCPSCDKGEHVLDIEWDVLDKKLGKLRKK